MLKSIVSSASLALGIAISATAAAQGGAGAGSCPPGSWFCAQDSQQQPAPAGRPLQPLPDPEDTTAPPPPPPGPPPRVVYQAGADGAPPVVVYQPPPPVVVVRPEAEPPPPDDAPPPPPPVERHRRSEWGMNFHAEVASIGHGSGDASMGGIGLGLRFKPTRRFGIESDVDYVTGQDYQGNNRNETALTFNGLFFLNPQSRAQFYLLAGFGWSAAHVTSDFSSLDAHYGYFGGQAGAGLELRLSHAIALNIDLRGFIRGRTDQQAQSQPEFTSSDGRTTNTSGGGLVTGGLTIYF
jgi:opacity protein-like surface antigen